MGRETLVTQGDRDDGLTRDQLDGFDPGFQRVDQMAWEAVVLVAAGRVLQHDDVGAGRRQ